MDKYVASLTTVNTPHNGTSLAENGLRVTPDKLVRFMDNKYDQLFSKLGDNSPDFFTGVSELTIKNCKELNEKMVDSPNVYYRSVGTMMSVPGNAPFPLSVSYRIIKNAEDDNDGLVPIESMKWGEFIGISSSSKKDTGISHGDAIDLTRKDLPGFDVCEFYVDLVQTLKSKGY
jgi:triacylglycerol lipase